MKLLRKTPSGGTSLAEAEAEVARTKTAMFDATGSVAKAAAEFGMDRRLMVDLQRLTGNEANQIANVNLSPEQRATLQLRVDFHAAVAAETTAQRKYSAALDARDELQRLADIAALGDGRAALAEAIRNAAAAVAALAEHDAAIEAAHQAVIDTYRAEDAAQAAIKQATEDAAYYAVAKVRGTAGDPPRTPKEARAELQDLLDGREALRAVHETLKDQRPSFQTGVTYAPDKVNRAIAHVVSVDPAVSAVVDEFARVNADWLRLKDIMDTLRRGGMLPEGVNPDRMPELPTDKPGAAVWTAAISAMRTDPAAKLPSRK